MTEDDLFLQMVQTDGLFLENLPRRTPELCLAAVKQNGFAIEYVPDELQTLEIWEAAIATDIEVVKALPVRFQTAKICLSVVSINGMWLGSISNPSPHICYEAVRQNGQALQFVRNQTPEICLAAVQQSGLALKYVQEQTPELCLAAMLQNRKAVRFICEKYYDLFLRPLDEVATEASHD